MAFNARLLISAEKDLDNALTYYGQISQKLSERFHIEFLQFISLLEQNPFFEIKYNSVRIYKLKSFPYTIHFSIDEVSKLVLIIAIVFSKQVKINFAERILI